jgi:SAM-dependent methyltransferase
MERVATERDDLDRVLARIPETAAHVEKFRRRMAPWLALSPGARVLDVGAAQGVTVLAFQHAGFEAYGVEPWEPAIELSHELERRTGETLDIVQGVAEELPYEDDFFDFVHSYSVMEHVDDPRRCFEEAYRVLKPGGGLLFSTTSAISPRQNEISLFVGIPWYPPPIRRRIFEWATEHRPALVGHTTRPAYHWFRHRVVARQLHEIGFRTLVNRWELRPAEENDGLRGRLIEAAKRHRAVRLLGDAFEGGMEYLAVK